MSSTPASAIPSALRSTRPASGLLAWLAWRLSLAVVLGGAVIVALLVALQMRLTADAMRDAAGRNLEELVQRAAEDIDSRMERRLQALDAVAQDPQVLDAFDDEARAEALLRGNGALRTLFDHLNVVRGDGVIVADSPRVPGRRGLNVAASAGFREIVAHLGASVATPARARVGNRPIVQIGVAVRRPDGSLAGALIGTLELAGSGYFQQLRETRIGATGSYLAFTRGGTMLLHADTERLLQPVPAADRAPAMHAAMAGASGWTLTAGDDGKPLLFAYRPLTRAPWVMAAQWPLAEAHASLARIENIALVAGIVAVALLAALVWLTVFLNLSPLRRLRNQLHELEQGRRTGHVDALGAADLVQVAGAVNRLLDVQTRLQETMRTRETFHRTLNEHSPLGIFVTDSDGQVTYVNRRLEEQYRRSFEQLAGSGWLVHVRGSDRRDLSAKWQDAFAAHAPLEVDFRVLVEAETRWLRVTAVPLFDQGAFTGYLGTVLDITRGRRVRLELMREKLRNDRVLAVIEDALIVVDEAGLVLHLSPVAERLFGFSQRAAAGQPVGRVCRLFTETDDALVDLAARLQGEDFAEDSWLADTVHERRLPVEVTWSRIAAPSDGPATLDAEAQPPGGGVLLLRDATTRRAQARQAQWDAVHDPLTRLLNRRGMERALAEAFDKYRREGVNSTLVMIDLDRFKQVNDRGGHDAGDEMLKKVAGCLQMAIRQTDAAARLGGDEFALLLRNCPLERAAAIAAAVREAVAALHVQRGTLALRIGLSQGLSTFAPGDAAPSDISARADAAAYRAKQRGDSGIERDLRAA